MTYAGEPIRAGEPTRERVRATIGQVGGYWRPLAAVARLQEELGELAELVVSGTHDAEQWASEFADLWIISTALADQFLGAVAEPDSSVRRIPADIDDARRRGLVVSPVLLAGLVASAGRIARIVNYYDGPKTPRSFDGWVSLSDAVAEFHRALADAAHARNVDLATAVSAKLDAIPTLDSSRFRAGEHDPSTAASLERFRALETAFVRPDESARLWGSTTWSSESFASNVQAVVADLTSFTKAAPWEGLDGYLVAGPTLTSIALSDDWLRRLLVEISERGQVAGRAAPGPGGGVGAQEAPGTVDGIERRLTFNGLDLLVSVFSPLYDTSDPRHLPADTFLMLWPQRADDLP